MSRRADVWAAAASALVNHGAVVWQEHGTDLQQGQADLAISRVCTFTVHFTAATLHRDHLKL